MFPTVRQRPSRCRRLLVTIGLYLLARRALPGAFAVAVDAPPEPPVGRNRRAAADVEGPEDEEDEYWTTTELLRYETGIDYLALHGGGIASGAAAPGLNLDLDSDPDAMARQVLDIMSGSLRERLAGLFNNTRTSECRAKIAEHFSYFVNAFGKEAALPFADMTFPNTCPEPVYDWENLPDGIHIGMIQNRSYQPPRTNETEHLYIDDPQNLRLLYAILTHEYPESTVRLIENLYEPGHVFVVHVDGKEASDETYNRLVEYAATRDHVHILGPERRVRVSWGGFSLVNATLQMLQYAFAVDEPERRPLEFHKFYHIASTAYPLTSNFEIRHKIASFPLDSNFVYTIMKPSRPARSIWHYFVECDDALHRIYRLPPLQNATHGVETYTSSQWFIISREFAQYLADPPPGSFGYEFLDYIQHVVVADETFFGTVLRNTEFCTRHHNSNFLHLQFDRWESDLPTEQRDQKKCMMLDPDHCGRSPISMTTDYAEVLELSDDLFARKFVDSGPDSTKVKDIIDGWRSRRQVAARNGSTHAFDRSEDQVHVKFAGHGVLIVAKATVNETVPLCFGLGPTGNKPKLVPCFYDEVVSTLQEGWETGAVILEETHWHNRWSVGPCSSDGKLVRSFATATMNVTAGNYSSTGPRCRLKQVDGQRSGRCVDADSGKNELGGKTQVFPCTDKWYQLVSFGDRVHAPLGSMYIKVPSHIVQQLHRIGRESSEFMCFGVGNESDEGSAPQEVTSQHKEVHDDSQSVPAVTRLSDRINHQIVTIPCTDSNSVIEWLFVPYIVEEGSANEKETNTTTKDQAEMPKSFLSEL